MARSTRTRSLTGQLVLPVVGLVLTAVLANVGFAAWLAARRSAAATRHTRQQVADSLRAVRVSFSPPVLDALHRLTGSHFLVWDESARRIGLSTLPPDTLATLDAATVAEALRHGGGTFAGQSFRLGTVRTAGVRPETVIVLTPARSVIATTLESVWPVLAVAAATLAVLVPLGLRTTRRLAARIGAVERHVARIAEGEFGHPLAAGKDAADDDEIGRLVKGVDHMSRQLEQLRGSLLAGERQRLLGQLAAGFAHELRNAVTGARLSIDVHRRRCPGAAAQDGTPDDSLGVAGRQLDILEEEVRGLLALAKPTEPGVAAGGPAAEPLSVDRLLTEVRDLTAPRCDHAGVRMRCDVPTGLSIIGRHDPLRAAMVNLALRPGGAPAGIDARAVRQLEARGDRPGTGDRAGGGRVARWRARLGAGRDADAICDFAAGTDTLTCGAVPPPRSSPSRPVSRILIVDDEPAIGWSLREMLSDEGHAVELAASVEEGLETCERFAPDAMLLDVRLPGRDGLAALPEFRAIVPEAPVVVMTAFGDLDTAVRAVHAGAFDYLVKPFDLDRVARVVAHALAERRHRGAPVSPP
ncbi:MAG: response regulator, partial [Planctomycetia bacterium]|nr:response regulator [Planctomycetia bacterium]